MPTFLSDALRPDQPPVASYESWRREAALSLENAAWPRDEARIAARLLLDGATGTRYAHLLAPDQLLTPEQGAQLARWLAEAKRGRPIPYILGRAAFFGLEFAVDERVLIPRPETELLVETALQGLLGQRAPRIADLGTGSGAIAVAIAKKRPDARVCALDVSGAALEVARINAAINDVAIEFVQGDGDWLSPLQPLAPFEAIVSNPPYIARAQIETLATGVRDFEPRLALDGGADGLAPYRVLAARAAPFLSENGFLALELGARQFGAARALFEGNGWRVEAARRDLAGIERVLWARPPR